MNTESNVACLLKARIVKQAETAVARERLGEHARYSQEQVPGSYF
jgi:hypothetical protein